MCISACRMKRKLIDIPESFLVEAIRLLEIVQSVFLECHFDPVQDVESVVFLRPTKEVLINTKA